MKTTRTIKTTFAIIALIAILATIFVPMAMNPTNANGYTDVNTNDWYYPAVKYMSTNGYMTGYSTTTFAPNDTLSRAMFVTILYRVSGEKVNANGNKFIDVPQNTWYTEAVTWAVANGITNGTSATTFSPNAFVTREQLATFMKRYIDSKNIKVSNNYVVTTTPQDMYKSSGWAKDAVQMMHKYGILLETNNNVYPTNNATRLETAVAFYNFLCLTKETNNKPLSYNDYNGNGNTSCNHKWETVHIPGSGHYETGGTHRVMIKRCDCGYTLSGDTPNADTLWRKHGLYCPKGYIYWYENVPNSEPVYVEDWPAKDVTYCPLCGAEK